MIDDKDTYEPTKPPADYTVWGTPDSKPLAWAVCILIGIGLVVAAAVWGAALVFGCGAKP